MALHPKKQKTHSKALIKAAIDFNQADTVEQKEKASKLFRKLYKIKPN